MRFLNYIKGDTQGSACREIERRSLSDPFLSDAIDGYEFCAGKGAEHIRNIAELGRGIHDDRAEVRRGGPYLLLICALLVILCAGIIMYFMA